MVCDREREIQAFDSQEYWSLTAHLKSTEPPPFEARCFKYEGKKADLKNGEQTLKIVSEIEDLPFRVSKVTQKRQREIRPRPSLPAFFSKNRSED